MAQTAHLRIGVDTGGTFTDLVLDPGPPHDLLTHKLLSTPDDPARAVLEGIDALLAKWSGVEPPPSGRGLPRVVHGSTVATNAVLEGKGGRCAFVTTEGFEDTLHIARQNRPALYALRAVRPEPPVSRDRCLGVSERMSHDGTVLRPLAANSVGRLLERLAELRVEAIAISLLHSYANPDHERKVTEALRSQFPDVHLTVSHELLPEFREYERAATCLVNALVAPPMIRYLGRLEAELGADRLRIMASSGGSLPPSVVARTPVHTILSGPAGGVLGAWHAAKLAGEERIITLDMGGTSTDVALCDGGPSRTTESEVAGLPVRIPMTDIHTVGAGGGSVAWLDAGGALHVGPASMGAFPGPACYGAQDRPYRATVTDAHVVLGHLPSDEPLSGNVRLDAEVAQEAVQGVARAIGRTVDDAARGILQVAEVTMARAVQRISVERGHDPRDFVLLPFGGAGGLHACSLAEALGMRRVLVPRLSGLLSALGMLTAAPLYTFSRSVMGRLEPDALTVPDPRSLPAAAEILEALLDEARRALDADGVPEGQRRFEAAADLRYEGQSYELTIPWDDPDPVASFEARHQTLYGYTARGRAIELVTLRLRASGAAQAVALPPLPRRTGPRQRGPARDPGAPVHGRPTPWLHVQRADLLPGDVVEGPIVVTEYAATTLVPRGWSLLVDPIGHLLLHREQELATP